MELKCYSIYIYILYTTFNNVLSSSEYCTDHGYTPEHGTRNPPAQSGLVFFPGSMIRYKCDEYFNLDPKNHLTQTCVRLQNGQMLWYPEEAPSCIEATRCPRPELEHGNVYNDVFHEGDHLYPFFSCDIGYIFSKEDDSICLSNGTWSSLPVCMGKNCTDPAKIDHGSFKFFSYMNNPNYAEEIFSSSNSWLPGTAIYYSCDQGYVLEVDGDIIVQGRVCTNGTWSGTEPQCVLVGCEPPTVGNYIPKQDHYEVHNTLTYICSNDVYDVTRTCQSDHTWSGTPCPNDLTTKQMPHTSLNNNVYCTTPLPVSHGHFECCSEQEVTGSSTPDPKYCCPVHGLVEFTCDSGFQVKGEATQWICGTNGLWISIDSPQYGSPKPPTCYSNMTRPEPNPMPDDMLKPVIGTAAGVLVILSAAILIAFCRPKLKDIKRRWRELREDEDELIIDGRRIVLPSYEEAVSCHDPYVQISEQEQSTSSVNYEVPGTSYPRDTRTNSNDDTSLILHVHPETSLGHGRISSSSDEEMLVPTSTETLCENLTESREQITDSNNRSSQSLVLKAGTSVDACVLINQTPCTQFPADFDSPQNFLGNIKESYNHAYNASDPLLNTMPGEHLFSNPARHKENSDAENDDSIFPQTIMIEENKNQIRSNFDAHHGLLSYPLIPDDEDHEESQQAETISINIDAGNLCDQNIPVNENLTKIEESTERESEESPPMLPNSDHIHIIMSSQRTQEQCVNIDDETGSTTV